MITERPVTNHTVTETLLHVRKLMLDLERHLDQAADEGDLTEIGRAWVRSEQVERALRAVVPPDVMEVAKAKEGVDQWQAGSTGTTP
jgi:hypothetical protein